MRIFLIVLRVLQIIYAPIFLMIGVLTIKQNFFLSLSMIFGSSVWLLHIFKNKISIPVKLQPFFKRWYLTFFPLFFIGIIFAPHTKSSDQPSQTENISQLTTSTSKSTKKENVTSKSSSSVSSAPQKSSSSVSSISQKNSSSSSSSASSATSTSKLETNEHITITKNQNDLTVGGDYTNYIGKSQSPENISFKVSDVKLSDGDYHIEWQPGFWSGSDPDYAYATITLNNDKNNLIQVMKDEPQNLNIKNSDIINIQMFGKGTGDTLKFSK